MRNLKHYKTDHDSTALVPRNSFEKVVVETVLLLSDNDEDIVHDDKRVTSPSQDIKDQHKNETTTTTKLTDTIHSKITQKNQYTITKN